MKHKVKHGKYQIPINDSTYRHVIRLRILGGITLLLYIAVASLTTIFVYHNVYNAIGFIDLAKLATIDTGAEIIDFQSLDRVQTRWEEKHTPSSTVFVRNPFADILQPKPHNSTTTIINSSSEPPIDVSL